MKEKFFNLQILVILALLLPFESYKNKEIQRVNSIQFSVVAEIGVEEAETKEEMPYQFSYIRSMDCDKEGNIYVLDHKDVCVKVFDKHGKFLRKMFREGKGPNELNVPYELNINKFTGNLFVAQEHGLQIKEFDVFGNFIKSYISPEQITHYFDFLDEYRLIYIGGSRGKKRYANFKIFNLKTSKIEKEFVSINRPGISNALQRFVIRKRVLWTCPGDKMELAGYDLKTGREIDAIPIPESYRKFKIIEGQGWIAVRLYNFAQPFLVDDKIYVFVTKQDFLPPAGRWVTHPKYRKVLLYRLEKDKFLKMSDFPEFDFFVDFQAAWQNRILVSSSGYDLYPQIKILEISE